jgi:methylmalonyl-CoA mutase
MKAVNDPMSTKDGSTGDVGANLRLREEFPAPTYEEWVKVVEEDLKGAEFDKKLLWKTPEGITVKPIYTRKDLEGTSSTGNLPGFAPFLRGTDLLGNVRYPWQVRQDLMLAAPEDVNGAIRDGVSRGETAVCIRLDNAARQGLDGDDPQAKDLAGRGGCTVTSINGLRIALVGVDLEKYPITLRTGTSALPVLGMLVALADERGLDRASLVGAVECDPFRELLKAGRLRVPFAQYHREMADMVTFCSKHLPGIRPIMVNSGPYHNAGATAVQELACVIAAGTEYLRALVARGISADTAAFSMTFAFSVSTNLFMEIAKLRAARGLWAKVVKAFGVENPDAQKMFLHARTSAFTKSVLDPHGNMIRGTIEGFAAAVGGCNSLYTAPFDEPIGRPDEFSMRIARNQQLLLLEEAYLGRVVDPAGGSYYVESLTDSLGREAWKLVQEYEAQGGFAAALKAGGPQKAIEAAAAKKREQIRLRRATQVGVSSSPNPKEKLIEKSHISRDAFIEERKRRIARLKAVRRSKDLQLSLQALIEAVRTHRGNLLELAVECAAEGATIGEIIRSLRTEGEVPHVAPLAAWRAASEFEGLRHRAAAFAKKTGALPKVFLVPMGPATMRRARAEFCHGFFGSGGFDVVEPAPFKTPEDAAKAILESGAGVAVLCSDDPSYPQIVPAIAKLVKDARPGMLLYVAGYPADTIEQLKAAGADGFVHIKADVIETLGGLQKKLGVV